MTQEEIIRMAREAGCHASVITGAVCFNPDVLERFAALVAAHEREKQPTSDEICQELDGCPTELAVLQRFWRDKQAEQEPVAWRCRYCKTDMPTEHASDCPIERFGLPNEYAAPVRTKDLTDDEINELWLTHGQGQMMYIHEKFARAVIAADRKKNK